MATRTKPTRTEGFGCRARCFSTTKYMRENNAAHATNPSRLIIIERGAERCNPEHDGKKVGSNANTTALAAIHIQQRFRVNMRLPARARANFLTRSRCQNTQATNKSPTMQITRLIVSSAFMHGVIRLPRTSLATTTESE